ncbi:Arc family DNA-binding protein [Rheinheimera sp. MMS21-TC3]|uniref:Arc family DNA-binding protein n=1 Tax=Rheinheimera sp. MMS21-TC3 TaxID=3072790 RepID=UPI0028C37FC6|nr:Arc family DNA-binding protein [Rheinheimera sp. MMS21-TC3]WNO60891.1 Arc family DNA-binding protein [Rheinheimera sp. MMS21-TC3]
MKPRDPQINIRLPEELKEQLHSMAAENKRSVNSEAVAAIEHAVHLHNLTKSRSETLQELNADGSNRYITVEEAEKKLLHDVIKMIYTHAKNNN